MSRPITLPPTEQYSIIETFSANTADIINQAIIHMVGNPPVTGNNSIYGDVYDLTEDIEYNPCVLSVSFIITKTSSTTLTVGLGECFITGVYIKIKAAKSLDTLDSDSYVDGAVAHSGDIYVVVKYDPTEIAPNAYVGLIKKATYIALSDSDKKKYLFLGSLDATYISSTVSDIITYYYDVDDDTQTRTFPHGFCDGGWIDLPPDLWHP